MKPLRLSLTLQAVSSRQLLLLLLLVGLLLRFAQWLILGAQIERAALLNADVLQLGHLLPPELWRNHFVAALLYLQQAPPLPALIYGVIAYCTTDAATLTKALIWLAGLFSSIAAALTAKLLFETGFSRCIAFLLPLVFIMGADVVVIEYFTFGQYFYEYLSMIEILAAAIAATRIARAPTSKNVVVLGLCVALLALTRSTFSYFVIPAAAWVVWICAHHHRNKLLVAFMLPVVALHGGWALKQKLIQEEWIWATSTWGGSNFQSGMLRREFALTAEQSPAMIPQATMSAALAETPCMKRWTYIWDNPENRLVTFPDVHKGLPSGEDHGPSPRAREIDDNVAQARDLRLNLDSAGFREFSQCLQQVYFRLWLQRPDVALKSLWMSYGLFWSSIAAIVEMYPTTLIPARPWLAPHIKWTPQGDFPHLAEYKVRTGRYAFAIDLSPQFTSATVLILPFVPALLSLCSMLLMHLVPLIVLAELAVKKSSSLLMTNGFGFFMVVFLYLATISSLAEYGENMRFRLPVEPLLWTMALITARHVLRLLKNTPHRNAI